MRIVHVSSAHPWTDNRIHYREAATLQRAGHEVFLIATESTVQGPDVGVKVVTIPRLPRIRRVLVSSVRAVLAALRVGADVYHLHDPELIWAVPLLRTLNKKVVYDAHEDLPVQVASKTYVKPPLRSLMVAISSALIGVASLSDNVVAATDKIAQRFSADKTSIVRNYPPLRKNEEGLVAVSERRRVLVYIGGIGEQRGATMMVSLMAARDLPKGWELSLAGRMTPSVKSMLTDMRGWEKVNYHGLVAPQEARDLLLEARVGLLLLQNTQAYMDSLPTKMFEYFAAGIPVIASDFPLWREIIDRHECGIMVDQNSETDVLAAVRRYAEDTELLELHSKNARRAAETALNWSSEAETLLALYERLQ